MADLTNFQSNNGGSSAFQFMNGGGLNSSGQEVAPPNVSSPVPASQITNGSALNFPSSAPSDNGNAFVAGAVAGASAGVSGMPTTDQSLTPGIDSASMGKTGDYTQDTGYQTAKSNLDNSQSLFASGVANAPSASDILNSAQDQFGVAGKLSDLNKANTDLAAATAAYRQASQQQETQGIQSGTPTVYYQGAQAAIQRQAAVDVGAKATVQAAAQGNYDRAMSLAQQTANFKYQDVQDKINRLAKFVEMNKDNLTAAEKLAVSKIDAQQKQQQIQLDQQKQAYTYSLTYPQAGILPTDNLPTAVKKASSWIAQNPYAGQKPTVIGSHYDDYGNKVETYGLVGANGQIKPLDFNSTQGNINFGMSTGTILGLPAYNTLDNNPGVSRPIRNNNPGNIKATSTSINYPGVVGVESTPAADGGNFLIFSNPQAGMNAVGQLLQSKVYKGLTAEQAIKKYNGGGSYGATDLGLDPNQDLQKQLQNPDVLQRVITQLATAEGFNASTSGVKGAVGTLGNPAIDSSTPGYNTTPVGKTQMTQSAIDQAALAYALGDKSVITSRTGKGLPLLQANAIKNRAAEINQGGNIAANKAQLTSLTSALTEQTKYLNTIDRSLTNAENGFNQITTAFSKAGINPSDSKLANTTINEAANLFGNNQEALRAFQAGIYEVQNEYSQVFSRGGSRTLEGNKEAQDLLNGNLSIKTLQSIQNELQAQGNIVKQGSQDQVQKIQQQINNILNPNSKTSAGQTIQSNGQTFIVGQLYNDGKSNWTIDAQGNWKKQ